MKMRRKAFLMVFIIMSYSIITQSFYSTISTLKLNNENKVIIKDLKISTPSEIIDTVLINDLPGSLTNWTWAKDQGFCTGSGTASDPYTITELFFNTSTISYNSLEIQNSIKHFIIENCEFKGNYNYAGVYIRNTTNGIIRNNIMHPGTGAFAMVVNSSYNLFYNNIVSGGHVGFLLRGNSGLITNNTISNNRIMDSNYAGVLLDGPGCIFNNIIDNILINNTVGIDLYFFAKNNIIAGNEIRNSSDTGLEIWNSVNYNEIYLNCFLDNNLHARDGGTNNTWDKGSKGNYWDNYTGPDANQDGIGDIPYNITGFGGSQDNFPLMECPPDPSTPIGGVPGYNTYILLIGGTTLILGMLYIIVKKKFRYK